MVFTHFQICSKTLQNSFACTSTFPMVLECFLHFVVPTFRNLCFDVLNHGFAPGGRRAGREILISLGGDLYLRGGLLGT